MPDFGGESKKQFQTYAWLHVLSLNMNSVSASTDWEHTGHLAGLVFLKPHNQLGYYYFPHFPGEMLRFREIRGLDQDHIAVSGWSWRLESIFWFLTQCSFQQSSRDEHSFLLAGVCPGEGIEMGAGPSSAHWSLSPSHLKEESTAARGLRSAFLSVSQCE